MEDFKVGGTHPVDLASGRLVEPGEVVTLSAADQKEQHNALLIKEGLLFKAVEGKEGGK